MLLDAAGPGDSSPSPTSSTYHSGSSRHTVYPHSLYLQHAGFSTIFSVFRPFSPIFAPFSAFLAPWPHLPGGTRSRKTEPGRREPQNPLGGGEKNHAPGGEPGRAQHSAGAGDGLPPPSQGRSAAQRQRVGTRHAGGETGARGQQTGDRAAQRRGRPADEAGPRRGGTPCPRKRAALAPAGRLPQMPRAAVPHGASGWGLWHPPRARNQPGQTLQRRPATGGCPPPPGPTLQVCTGAANNALAPRPQVADGGIA